MNYFIDLRRLTGVYMTILKYTFWCWYIKQNPNIIPALFCVYCCVMNFTSTSTVYYSVICQGRQVLFTIFIKFRQKSFRIWFQIGSYIFGRSKKMHLKNNFWSLSSSTKLQYLSYLASNQKNKDTLFPSTFKVTGNKVPLIFA